MEYFDFNQPVVFYNDILTVYKGKPLILKDVRKYEGPITLQYLPYGGIQSVFDYKIIIWTKSGFIYSVNVEYDGKEMSGKEFILENPNLVNTILPNFS